MNLRKMLLGNLVSIHAPARGATLLLRYNSEGGYLVSIHAPARGATYHSNAPSTLQEFQSTRPRGARRSIAFALSLTRTFQSTRPRGARPRRISIIALRIGFNPRAREGRDGSMRNNR